ncbi:hypothetical protein A3A64_03750 [Candidatus Gottesmanbacteria bacterium RIFCSPLOWO2_01_FULL_48_11]|uniref:General secretion pathway protein G n=2 Tax=Candidatus Gottesmaniibacteriota TaxID=1752720 RepID=A0A0G1U344_9BACT|nr:MAG: hypothetical protein UY16_C0006G0011 [Candidatus Gottesmanbacteria bacterium GW2011_GWA2_47_9]OGG27675.1 MAG: hypothetical protein A3A64_03750 [Candidatus Gottesmanbacteria bacterium RIFCSPLOWO2_01_FULL_48_11]
MELLIVMVLLGILVGLGLTSFRGSQVKSRDSRRKAELRQISLALEAYFNDKGKYPNDDAAGKIKGCTPDDNTVCNWGEEFKDMNSTLYMITLPADPGGLSYYYDVLGSSNAQYQLYARLENTLDSDVNKDEGNNPQVYSGLACGAKTCNYGIASTNTSADTGRTLATE